MLIAVDGAPLTGKTSLVQELLSEWQDATSYCPEKETPAFCLNTQIDLFRYEDHLFSYDPLSGKSLILDGSHLGEYVWPEVYRHPTPMIDPAIRRHVEMFMCSRGCVTIYAVRDYSDLHEALAIVGGDLRPASLALALERFEFALNEAHTRGYVYEHDHVHRHLSPQDIAFVAGQADDDVRPFYGITHRWIGHPQPQWVIALAGCSGDGQFDLPGRVGDSLHPTVAHILRTIPERAWRGVALVELDGMSEDGLREFARLADARSWVTVGDRARDLVNDIVHPQRCWSPGYAIASVSGKPTPWDIWHEDGLEKEEEEESQHGLEYAFDE